jgi:hypothetical protein
MATAQQGGRLRSGPGAYAARWTARLALAGVIGPVFYVVAISAMYFLRPNDVVLYGNTIGFYSVGPFGNISVVAFIALGLCALAFVFRLRRTGSSSHLTTRPFGSPTFRITGWRVKGDHYV